MLKRITNRALATALCAVAVMTFLMVVVGGLTRLTGSGLSIVSWKPITGIIPPLNTQDWLREFAHYQQFPEYQQVNFGMTLDAFKSIFWLEFIHRFLGRFIGLVLLVPTLMTWGVPALRIYRARVLVIWILGGAQGAMGWYMVKSGLIQDPVVNPLRLTAHLLLAFLILGYVLWVRADVLRPTAAARAPAGALQYALLVSLTLVIVTVAYGGLTAGLHAGLVYNTFPRMGPYWVPPEVWGGALARFIQDPVVVQFAHRCLATATGLIVLYTGSLGAATRLSRHFLALQAAIGLQFLLGVMTLLGQVPVGLAVLHQGWAVVVFALTWWLYLQTRRGMPVHEEIL